MDIIDIDKDKAYPFVRRLAEERYGRVDSVKYIGGGSFGMAYLIERKNNPLKMVIKAYRVAGMNEQQALELRTLAGSCSLKLPEVYFVHNPTDDIPVYAMGMEYIEGINACDGRAVLRALFMSRKRKDVIADKVITAVHSIHETKASKYGLLGGDSYDSWDEFYRPMARGIYEWTIKYGIEKRLPRAVIALVKYSYEQYDRIFADKAREATLIHADLNTANIMLDRKTLMPIALIDPYNSMYGDREYELHQLYNLNGNQFGFYRAYKRKYPVSATCDLKCAFYALFNEVYCYMLSGVYVGFLFPFQCRNLKKQLIKYSIIDGKSLKKTLKGEKI